MAVAHEAMLPLAHPTHRGSLLPSQFRRIGLAVLEQTYDRF